MVIVLYTLCIPCNVVTIIIMIMIIKIIIIIIKPFQIIDFVRQRSHINLRVIKNYFTALSAYSLLYMCIMTS